MAKADGQNLIIVGALAGAHGVRGEVRVRSFTQDPEALFSYGPLLAADGRVVLTPKSSRPAKDHFIVQPVEAHEKEYWDGLKGERLHVPRARLPETQDDEFYIEDLAGLQVVDGEGALIGRVVALHNFGGGDLLEISLESQSSTVLVPFSNADVAQVNLAEGRLTIPDIRLWMES